MPIYATQTGGKEYAKAPAGTHRAVCIGIYDVGTQESPEYGPNRKALIQWELSDEPMEDGRPFSVSRQFTLSLHEKSSLLPIVNGWRGKSLTEDEARRFDVTCLLGKACMISVIHKKKGDRTNVEVTSVSAMPKGMAKPEPVNPLRTYSFEDGDDYPEGMPEWIIRRIGESVERRAESAARAGQSGGSSRPASAPAGRPATGFNVPGKTVVPDDEDDDDGIPF